MALLSVVVPVYRVPEYLGGCLDSILTGAPAAVEVIAVDDRSPDDCGHLLDEYAQRDERVRVLHLPENVGLGPARNAGLDAAKGEYVWFVDSDDWLPPGSVAAVVDRLAETRPDVLLLDHDRVYDDGHVELDRSSSLLRAVPDVVTLAERPELLCLQHTAWNRVTSKALLDRLGLRFFPGWYEDFPFSHPSLIGAERIAVLDRVCYHYRQRGNGAITRTPSPRIFEVFDQYDRLMELVPAGNPYRPRLFERMIEHLLVILGHPDRVPPDLRRAFFRRIAEYYRRYHPTGGYPRPSGVGGVRHRMVQYRAYGAYASLRWAYRLGRPHRPAPGQVAFRNQAVGKGIQRAALGDGE